ncbi:probable protein phosphatase 2C 74 [Magnolia sinica]|uniref:probable protein phosphatase 2C 74 n=1 Tax=Magnolia sinica TaxID=86752 RepID=UPI0026597BAC|nr:probable protein phosphatase 2C 74 [Magnolia sinica]
MIDMTEFPWNLSLISFLLRFPQMLRKIISMTLSSSSPLPSSSPSLPWMHLQSPDSALKHCISASEKCLQGNSHSKCQVPVPEGLVFASGKYPLQNLRFQPQDLTTKATIFDIEENPQENSHFRRQNFIDKDIKGLNSMGTCKGGEVKVSSNARKRPARIIIPQCQPDFIFDQVGLDLAEKECLVEGKDYYVASKRGRRMVMEDGYEVITNIHGDSKQAYFGVFDGHGGRAAVDYVTEKLGKNIIAALGETERGDSQLEEAIRAGYLTTDKNFLSKALGSGACVATVILKDGELNVANVGDCRVILSRKGIAEALTNDHSAGREDERLRIERTGGYVACCKGVWRVQGSLAVSRAIGDMHMKEWIISEPETNKIRLTSDCEFLIMASDGLWEKVTNQEAVDVVLRNKNSIESCKKLVDLSWGRGSEDDITVIVVHLQHFTHMGG